MSDEGEHGHMLAARSPKHHEVGGGRRRRKCAETIAMTGSSAKGDLPHSGEGCGDAPHDPISVSLRTDLLLKWVRRWLIRLHHSELCEFESQCDDELLGAERWREANNDAAKS